MQPELVYCAEHNASAASDIVSHRSTATIRKLSGVGSDYTAFAQGLRSAKSCCSGQDSRDATSSAAPVVDYAASLPGVDQLNSKPLQGKRIGAITELLQGGVAPGVASAIQKSIAHLQSLGAEVSEVSCMDQICQWQIVL